MSFCVIGSGIIGLTTALELQSEFPNAQVTIIADKFFEKTTSYVAAGLFRPSTSFSGPTPDITRKWLSDAYQYWDDLQKSADSSVAGVCKLSGYIFSNISPRIVMNQHMENLVEVYRRATDEELTLCNGNWKYGSFFTTVLTDCSLFLPYATEKFRRKGGKILQKSVNSFTDLVGKFDIIMNCSGLGAKELCSDSKLLPIRGQVLKVKAPWIKIAFYSENDTYIIPGFNSVTLGGTYDYGNYKISPCKYQSAAIRERCYNLVPNLKSAEVVNELVGLRPHRDIVRVEPEILKLPTGNILKVIHNYGHGGYGVTAAPGTAKLAIKQAKDFFSAKYHHKL